MKFFLVCFLLFIEIAFFAKPKAFFSTKIDSSSSTIELKNKSSGASLYIISFGDGTVIRDTVVKDYIHAYAIPGRYDICIVAINITSSPPLTETDTFCSTIEIFDYSCKADFDYFVDDFTLYLRNRSSGNYKQWYWDINGIKENKIDSVKHVFFQPGLYKVVLFVSNSTTKCYSFKDTTILIQGNPDNCVAYFTSNIEGNTVIFENRSIGSYDQILWEFGDGNVSNEINPTYIYKYPGKYEVTLTVLKASQNIYSSYKQKLLISLEELKYLPDFEYINEPDNLTVLFKNISLEQNAAKYFWTFGDGTFGEGSSIHHTYSKAGFYDVCLTQLIKNNRYTQCKTISVNQQINPISFTYLENNQIVKFLPQYSSIPSSVMWDFGDGFISDNLYPSHQYEKKDIYLVTLKIKHNEKIYEKHQIVNLTDNKTQPLALFKAFTDQKSFLKSSNDKKVRYKGILSGNVSRIRFQWQFGDGNIDTLSISPIHYYSDDSSFTACITVYNDLLNDSSTYCQKVHLAVKVDVKDDNRLDVLINNQNEIVIKCHFVICQYIKIDLIDYSGRVVSNIYTGKVDAQPYLFRAKCKPGIYFLRLNTMKNIVVNKVLVP